MGRRLWCAVSSSITVTLFFQACGARTGLLVPEESIGGEDVRAIPLADVGTELPADVVAEPVEAIGGGADSSADAPAECSMERYCDPSDPAHVYQCGRPIIACGLLEQCEERSEGAQCVNPCLDSLGNDTSNGCDFYAV
jgi:hypothetical protein